MVDSYLERGVGRNLEHSFLTDEEEDRVRDYYAHLTHQILGVGDADARRQTNKDVASISEARLLSKDSMQEGIEIVQEIMSGSNHSILAKSLATIAYTDISMENNYTPQEFWEFLRECILTEPEPGGREVLAGTFYARMAFHLLTRENGEGMLQQLDRELIGKIVDAETEKRKLGIHVSARVVSSLLDEDRLRMVLPSVIVHKGTKREALVYPKVGGYPYTLMYLPTGSLPQDEKLVEAVYYGMPHISSGVLIRRIPRVMVGVEVAEKGKETRSRKSKLVAYPNRRFTHIYLRGLRKPTVPADEAFIDERDYQEKKVFNSASFDSLSFMGAVRVTRYLEKRFVEIDSQKTTSLQRKFISEKEYKDERKRASADRAVERWIKKIAHPIVRVDRVEQSILSVALDESQKHDGIEGWELREAEEHLRYTIKALVLVNSYGNLFLRGEREIATLYQNYVWKKEFTEDDKLELAYAILDDPKSRLWVFVPEDFQTEVAQAIHGRQNLDGRTKRRLINLVERKVILRLETIVDTQEPLGLRIKRVKST